MNKFDDTLQNLGLGALGGWGSVSLLVKTPDVARATKAMIALFKVRHPQYEHAARQASKDVLHSSERGFVDRSRTGPVVKPSFDTIQFTSTSPSGCWTFLLIPPEVGHHNKPILGFRV